MSIAAVAAPAIAAHAREAPRANDYIDIASFRPRPRIQLSVAVVRKTPPYWLGWPGASYDVEGERKRYLNACRDSARDVGADMRELDMPIETVEAANAFAASLAADKPDAVVLILQHLDVWPWADIISKSGVPTIVFAPIGTAFTGHVLKISRQPGVHVISSLETNAIAQAMRMVRAKKQLAQTCLLVIAGEERKEEVMDHLGVRVKRVPRATLHQQFEQMPEDDETYEVARMMRRGAEKVVEPTRQDTMNAARSYQTAKRILRDEGANAVTSDCLGMVTTKVVPTPPCMAAALFQDNGVTYACEADVMGALSMLLTSYLFDKPGFMNDPVPETVKNVLIAAHCTSGTRLNGFNEEAEPYVLRSHSESSIGVSMQVLWREGQPVTLVSFKNPKELIVDAGAVVANVQTPPAGGCRTNFEIAMNNIEDCRDVAGFHQVVFYGDHKRDVEAFCQMHGIAHVHSPERAPVSA
ncbi:MAG: hypothetical protein HUU46_14910 [Candidatus Hydrogenedentes bacterium]|nr:hypothetical protein [Candidatus Hydrogenedentota bacterium]